MSDNISSADLFDDQVAEGVLSPSSASVLGALAGRIDRSMAPLAVVPTVTTQTVLGMLLDNSPSMTHNNNARSVVNGHNLVLSGLLSSKSVNSIEVLTQLLNPDASYIRKVTGGADVFKWTALRAAPKLVEDSFTRGMTPFYDRVLELLGSVVARTKWWEDEYAVQTTSRILLMSDGEDNDSKFNAADVAQVVSDMLAMEKHQIFLAGIAGYQNVDFKGMGKAMGLPDHCIDVVPSDEKQIRAWLELRSQSAVSVAVAPDPSSIGFGNN